MPGTRRALTAAVVMALVGLSAARPTGATDDLASDAVDSDHSAFAPIPEDRSALAGDAPLSSLEPDQATAAGADRMLLAIDALAELGAFGRAVQPEVGTLIRDVRDSIPSEGLTSDGYIAELEQFVDDFVPFLDSLERSGVEVSDELWFAIDDLEFIGLEAGALQAGSTAFLPPEPWIVGVGDLLVRGGKTAPPAARLGDGDAIRSVLPQLRIDGDSTFTENAPAGAGPTGTVDPGTLSTDPTPRITNEPPSEESSSNGFPLAIVGVIVLAVGAAVTAILLLRRSSRPANGGETGPSSDREGPLRGNDLGGAPLPTGAASDAAGRGAPSVTDLLDASRRMTSSLNATSIAAIALAEARRLVDADGGIVVRPSNDGLDPVSCEPPMLFNYDHIEDGCLPRVIATGRSTASIATAEPLLVEVPMAMAAVPIVADGVVSGAILVVRVSARPFDRDELDSLEMLAPLVGSAFAAADTHESATELVDVEPLTGLQNRRRLDLDLASISADAQVAYVMVDIDHFKNFNDANGHAAGDEALRQVSALLADAVRPKDLVYRYGGEEFCVLLPGATAAVAAEVAERARAAVESAHIPGMESQPDGRITISVGVSDSAWGAPNNLAEQADAALYAAKRNGRNQVALHQP